MEKIQRANVTNRELEFLLHICNYQEDTGVVPGVYYKDICSGLGMSHQTFYNVLHGLRSKGIVVLQKVNRIDWDILIVGNDCSNQKEVEKEGYLSLADGLFAMEQFRKMKANEKLLAMLFLTWCRSGKRTYQEGKEKLLARLRETLGCGLRAVQKYFTHLREFFSIGIKEGKYLITLRKSIPERLGASETKTDAQMEHEHKVQCACNRNGIKNPDEAEIAETAQLGWKQYKREIQELVKACRLPKDYFSYLIGISISGKQDKNLMPKYIHKLLKNEIQKYENWNDAAV